ncbi:MAG: DciA family protein [Rhodobacteraceae bacterium]|nr:DciA family protein [Paracoccaceae bacterium]
MPAAGTEPASERRSRGFERAASLVAREVRAAGEGRGFAVSRLLTHWDEVVGPEIAALARPVKVTYGPRRREPAAAGEDSGGFGATLTLLAAGAAAPLVQMRLPEILARVNACYGYAAISHVRVTQTSAEGFAEAPARYVPPAASAPPEVAAKAEAVAAGVADPALRDALAQLARNVLSRS